MFSVYANNDLTKKYKKTTETGVVNSVQTVVFHTELHMSFITKIKKIKTYLTSIDNIRCGDFTEIQFVSKCNTNMRFLLYFFRYL